MEEQDILDRFERGELRPSSDAADEIAVAREAAVIPLTRVSE